MDEMRGESEAVNFKETSSFGLAREFNGLALRGGVLISLW